MGQPWGGKGKEALMYFDLEGALEVFAAGGADLSNLVLECEGGRPMLGLSLCAFGVQTETSKTAEIAITSLIMKIEAAAGIIAELTQAAKRAGLEAPLTAALDQYNVTVRNRASVVGDILLTCQHCGIDYRPESERAAHADCPGRPPS